MHIQGSFCECAQPMRDDVTSYLIGWVHTQSDPCMVYETYCTWWVFLHCPVINILSFPLGCNQHCVYWWSFAPLCRTLLIMMLMLIVASDSIRQADKNCFCFLNKKSQANCTVITRWWRAFHSWYSLVNKRYLSWHYARMYSYWRLLSCFICWECIESVKDIALVGCQGFLYRQAGQICEHLLLAQ